MIRYIYQVEVSNFCNLKCYYCPHPTQKRLKGNMSEAVFDRVLELHERLGQRRIILHNFGDPLMHPNIVDFVRKARAKVEFVGMSTNGVAFTREVGVELKKAGITHIVFSKHTSHADHAAEIAKQLGIPSLVRWDFNHDWAGTSKKHKKFYDSEFSTEGELSCAFLLEPMAVVLWNGDVNVCCMDTEGLGVVGNVMEPDILDRNLHPIELCGKCTNKFSYDKERNINWILRNQEKEEKIAESAVAAKKRS